MELLEQVKEHKVTDYDFMFAGGQKLAIVIDHDAGDLVQDLPDRYVLDTVERPGLLSDEDTIDAAHVEVYKSTLAFVSRITRIVRMPTPDEVFERKTLIHKLAKGVQ